tara:strand:- start:2172 stop:4604 length:2433 start_codon:yes stop_codon:yes gene_type:complete
MAGAIKTKKRSSKENSAIDNTGSSSTGSTNSHHIFGGNKNINKGTSNHTKFHGKNHYFSSMKTSTSSGFLKSGIGESEEKRTTQYVTNISEPNILHQYASYNPLFTLSALSQADLLDTTTLLNSKPHDIIIQSSGIGSQANQRGYGPLDARQGRGGETLSGDNKKFVDKNEGLSKTLNKARKEFQKNRDLYFRNVTMNSVNGHNSKRRLTNITDINMEIMEPFGISLIDRIRAAAANNDYLDHLDAPYLLTVEFTGWDELGKVVQPQYSTKRVIPVKLTDMKIDISQGGSVYSVRAIPWSEFAYVNRFAYPRTAGTLSTKDKKLNTLVVELQNILNKQGEDNEKDGTISIPDEYQISIDNFFEPDTTEIELDSYVKREMHPTQGVIETETGDPLEFLKFSKNDHVTAILDQIMKGHPKQRHNDYENWKQKVTTVLASRSTNQAVYDAAKEQGWYYKKYQIRSTVIPTNKFDPKRATNAKIIKFVVEPLMIHAYSLAVPGVSTGDNFKSFVHKTYNYIFTGENVDVLDLNIHYKVAYFQSRLSEGGDSKRNRDQVQLIDVKTAGITESQDHGLDQSLLLKSEPGEGKSADNLSNDKTTELDNFLDYLANPEADMVTINLEILGDPAWLGQSQFIPANPEMFAPGVSEDKDISYWRAGLNAVWNNELKCYNPELADPIVLINFRMPTDLDDKTGIYELQSDQSATFSGLYRVYQIEHSFDNGMYKNILKLVRFNNQGVKISTPMREYRYLNKKDGTTHIVHHSEIPENFLAMGGQIFSVQDKLNSLFAKVKSSSLYKTVARTSKRIKDFFNV